MISDLRMKSGAHWKKIVEKYGSGEKGTVLDFKDFLQGRQAASVTLHGCSVELPVHRQNFIEFIYAYEGRIVTEIDGKELVQKKGDILLMNQYVEHRVKPTGNENEALILAALPDFFEKPLEMMKKQSLITDFLANMFRQNSKKPELFDIVNIGSINKKFHNNIHLQIIVMDQSSYPCICNNHNAWPYKSQLVCTTSTSIFLTLFFFFRCFLALLLMICYT